MPDRNELIARAIRLKGRQADLAREIGCAQQTVSKLLYKEIPITAEVAVAIDRATKGAVSKHSMRPDLFGRRVEAERVPS